MEVSNIYILPFYIKSSVYENGITKKLNAKISSRKIILRGEPFEIIKINDSVEFYRNGKKLQGNFFYLKSSIKNSSFFKGVEMTKKGIDIILK